MSLIVVGVAVIVIVGVAGVAGSVDVGVEAVVGRPAAHHRAVVTVSAMADGRLSSLPSSNRRHRRPHGVAGEVAVVVSGLGSRIQRVGRTVGGSPSSSSRRQSSSVSEASQAPSPSVSRPSLALVRRHVPQRSHRRCRRPGPGREPVPVGRYHSPSGTPSSSSSGDRACRRSGRRRRPPAWNRQSNGSEDRRAVGGLVVVGVAVAVVVPSSADIAGAVGRPVSRPSLAVSGGCATGTVGRRCRRRDSSRQRVGSRRVHCRSPSRYHRRCRRRYRRRHRSRRRRCRLPSLAHVGWIHLCAVIAGVAVEVLAEARVQRSQPSAPSNTLSLSSSVWPGPRVWQSPSLSVSRPSSRPSGGRVTCAVVAAVRSEVLAEASRSKRRHRCRRSHAVAVIIGVQRLSQISRRRPYRGRHWPVSGGCTDRGSHRRYRRRDPPVRDRAEYRCRRHRRSVICSRHLSQTPSSSVSSTVVGRREAASCAIVNAGRRRRDRWH